MKGDKFIDKKQLIEGDLTKTVKDKEDVSVVQRIRNV